MRLEIFWILAVFFRAMWPSAESDRTHFYWTFDVPAYNRSYIFYYKGDLEEFVYKVKYDTSGVPGTAVSFNSALYFWGAMAADIRGDSPVFVHESNSGHIYRLDEDIRNMELMFAGSSDKVEDIAVDWISRNIYYTDPLVGVGLVSYTKRFTIIIHKVAALHGIDIDPLLGLVFYADGDSGHIHEASLSGDEDRLLAGVSTVNPTSVAVDVDTKTLFWLDEGTQYLQAWDYANSQFKQLYTSYFIGQGAFTGIDLYQIYLFISQADQHRMKVVANNGSLILSFSGVKDQESRSHGLAITATERQPSLTSACDDKNGGCEHICIHISNIARQCLCQFGYKLQGDRCKREYVYDAFLMFIDSSANVIYQVDAGSGDFHALVIPPEVRPSLKDVVYDPEAQAVYLVGIGSDRIWSIELENGGAQIFVSLDELSTIETVAFDMTRRNLYYVNSKLKHISRLDLETKQSHVILALSGDEEPGCLALDDSKRMMYWIDSGTSPKIERADMDTGLNRQILISAGLQNPSLLALDVKGGSLYWFNDKVHIIEKARLDGSQRVVFTSTPSSCQGLAMDEQFIYVAERRRLWKIVKTTETWEPVGPSYFNISSGLLYFEAAEKGPASPDKMITIAVFTSLAVVVLAAILTSAISRCKKRQKRQNRSSPAKRGDNDDGYLTTDLSRSSVSGTSAATCADPGYETINDLGLGSVHPGYQPLRR